ncbi:DUF4365 domain-containing protein [Rhodopirellula sp. P2]|uniref:DUF4365 domain-containing protein n=1 Tax=Rhodopirellula sp. P2 TaxID=2127060 RepID=UPI002368C4E8|nr:DUF4365 domain-containing protein [Rhodopirellula sp. P2]WDQ17038.1 DUF4365 domain-containing protein [Rhodopirellula sp. P2]
MKRITDQQVLGEKGVNLIQSIVLDMKFTWHPSNQPVEAGIDGWVELRDDTTGEVKNCWIAVQSKARSELRESKGCPTFSCSKDDVDYWLSGSSPVVLIVSKPEEGVAYWVSVKDYFRGRDPDANRTIHFHPTQDRLTASTAEQWKALGNRYGAGTYFTPPKITETLSSNLIRINRVGQTVFTAETDCDSGKEARLRLKEAYQYPPWEWAYGNGKKIYSFHNLGQEPWKAICNVKTVQSLPTKELALADDRELNWVFVQLLRGCFTEITRSWKLRWSKESQCHYFAPSERDVVREFKYRSRQKRTSRTVVKKYSHKKDANRIAYYRHNALTHRFIRFGDQWFLLLDPTYVFTSDGAEPDPYREEHLAGIMQREGDAAVSGAVVMYMEMLKDRTSMFESPYELLGFGEIVTGECEVGIDDEAWKRIKAKADEQKIEEPEDTGFGEGLFD